LRMKKCGDSLQAIDVRMIPDAEILRADASFRGHGGCFREHERRSTHRACAEVNEMPVGREAVDARVLTHRRDDQAMGKGEIAERDGIEEVHGVQVEEVEKWKKWKSELESTFNLLFDFSTCPVFHLHLVLRRRVRQRRRRNDWCGPIRA